MNDQRQVLQAGLAALSIEVGTGQVDALLAYVSLLREWSRSYNLVAPGDLDRLVQRHILDSLSIAPWLAPGRLLDVGTGAGLPGIPLAIVEPGRDVILVDSAGKKIRFLRHVARTLGLTNVSPVQHRVETLKSAGVFANITSRAFASLRDFVQVVRAYTSTDSRLLAMKGGYPGQELEDLPEWIKLQSVEKLEVPGLHAERHLVIMTADRNTEN